MKKLQKNFRTVIAAVMSIFIIALTPAHAEGGKGNGLQVDVKWIGFQNDSPVFQLSFANEEADEFYISIRDNHSNIIYSEKVKGINLSRKFQLVNEEQEEGDISFEISSKKTGKTVKYKVNTTTRVISDTQVVKID
jgi:GTP cyclohydrolase FolE2